MHLPVRAASRLLAALVVIGTLVAPLTHASAQSGHSTAPGETYDRSALFAQTLIDAALIAGEIDYPTSLLYRTYAIHGDARLPADLAGAGSIAEDHALFRDVPRAWDHLPPWIRDRLTLYFVRPTDPRSRFAGTDTGARDGSTVPLAQSDGECQNGWISRNGEEAPYKVWMHCSDDYEADFDTVVETIDGFWQREVDLMGEPLPDGGSAQQGGDTRIDFYFLDDESDPAPRYGQQISPAAAATSISDVPYQGRASSAFVIARRDSIGDPRLSLTLAHEFFHVLSLAHNQQITFGYKGTPYTTDFDILTRALAWFTEACADWMKSYIYRDSMPANVMRAFLHSRFLEEFQGVDLPLTFSTTQADPRVMHSYGAYVYFLFLEQERGAQAIGDFWRALEDVEADDFDRMTAILDEILPFEQHFRDFAVRNFNADLPGDPISPSYQDIDPTFPTRGPKLNFAPGQNGKLPLQQSDEPAQTYADRIPNLVAHYYYFTPNADATRLTFDFSGLVPNEAIDVDAIVKIKGGEWEPRRLVADGPVTFCLETPADNVEQLYLVISNHDWHDTETVTGSFSARADDGACP